MPVIIYKATSATNRICGLRASERERKQMTMADERYMLLDD